MTLVAQRWKIPGMDEPPELQYNGHWRMAVWALRVGYVGLAVAIAGLIVMSLVSRDPPPRGQNSGSAQFP